MSENPDPRKQPLLFERKVLMIVLIVVVFVTVSYFMLRTIDMETASDRTHGVPNPDYTAEETMPPANAP